MNWNKIWNKIDFVGRRLAEGKTFVSYSRTVSWFRILLLFFISVWFLYLTFTTQKPGAYQMRWVAIGLTAFILINILVKLFIKPKHRIRKY